MSKFYVILPTCLLIVFGVYYTQVAKPAMAAATAAEQKRQVDQAAIDEANRHQIELKAQQDAIRQQEERAKKDLEREEKARKQQEDQDNQVREETNRWLAESATLTRQTADLQKEIADLRNQREALNREVYDDAAKVEIAKIDRRVAELDLQRMYSIVGQKVDESFLTKIPPPPPAK
jgi:predicted RNase H-like nuclease (RuvC/YqgF family)